VRAPTSVSVSVSASVTSNLSASNFQFVVNWLFFFCWNYLSMFSADGTLIHSFFPPFSPLFLHLQMARCPSCHTHLLLMASCHNQLLYLFIFSFVVPFHPVFNSSANIRQSCHTHQLPWRHVSLICFVIFSFLFSVPPPFFSVRMGRWLGLFGIASCTLCRLIAHLNPYSSLMAYEVCIKYICIYMYAF